MSYLKGIFAASITPLTEDYSPDLEAIPDYLDFLAGRGCHGALLLGTTGEGQSFSHEQRIQVVIAGLSVREKWPEFKLLAGTSTSSLDETVKLTKAAYELGVDGALVLPPYYFRNAAEAGLLSWFSEVINRAVPEGSTFLAYHIPGISGVNMSIEFLEKLTDLHPTKFSGIKDSSGDLEFANQLGNRFGEELLVFTGNDRLLSVALNNQASGCITALANLISPDLKSVWEGFASKKPIDIAQNRINQVRKLCEKYPPFPPLIKFLLNRFFSFITKGD